MALREYARHRARLGLDGGTLRAVQVAIKSGRLRASLAAGGKKIAAAKLADAEWAATTKADMVPLTGPTAPRRATTATDVNLQPDVRGSRPVVSSAPAPVINDLGEARARREAAVARLAEIDLAEREGTLIPARDIEARLADVFLSCRTRLLAIVSRLREQDPTLRAEQVGLVEALIHEALESLAGDGAA